MPERVKPATSILLILLAFGFVPRLVAAPPSNLSWLEGTLCSSPPDPESPSPGAGTAGLWASLDPLTGALVVPAAGVGSPGDVLIFHTPYHGSGDGLNPYPLAAGGVGLSLEGRFRSSVYAGRRRCLGHGAGERRADPRGGRDESAGALQRQRRPWYHAALANSRAGPDLSPGQAEIAATFNSAVDDDPNCFSNTSWWYGIGVPAPPGTIDFFTTVLHELGHGLGVSTFVNSSTGQKLLGLDDAYMFRLEDHSRGGAHRLTSALFADMGWPMVGEGGRLIFADGFETGGLGRWDAVIP